MMDWLKGAEQFTGKVDRTIQRGRKGQHAFILDFSGSMDTRKLTTLSGAFQALQGQFPNAAIIGFASKAKDITYVQVIRNSHGIEGGTMMAEGVKLAIPFRPDHTVIISDGGVGDEADLWFYLKRLTGAVSTVYTYIGPQNHSDRRLMQDIARRHGGRALDWDKADDGGELARKLRYALQPRVTVEHRNEYHRTGQPVRQRIGVGASAHTVRETRTPERPNFRPFSKTNDLDGNQLPPASEVAAKFLIQDKREIPMQPIKRKSWLFR